MLKLQEFIKHNDNWEELLSAKPFALSIKRDGEYVLFSYNMIESDFSNPIVQECRGLILYEPTMEAVCVPFFKFFNVQEGNAAEIDWNTAIVTEKVDGSIIKLWYHGGLWHVSTNGTIDAGNAMLSAPADFGTMIAYSYYDLFTYAAFKYDFITILNNLDRGFTYMFELVSPFNRVVVPYSDTKIYHIGSRNNWNLYEEDLDIGIEKPKTYSLSSLEDCLNAVAELPFSDEGYVVRDWRYNRVKIKSPAYVAAHHLKNNGAITYNRLLDLFRSNGQDDFVSVYPEYKVMVDKLNDAIIEFAENIGNAWAEMPAFAEGDRKSYALWANETVCPTFFFSLLKNPDLDEMDWLMSLQNEKILRWIGLD